MKIVINKCYGGYYPSEEAIKYVKDRGGNPDNRTDQYLVEYIEKYGSEKASSEFSLLKIVEIPDTVKWEIENYDGSEWVSEVHRIWN